MSGKPLSDAGLEERPTNQEYPHTAEAPPCTGDETGFLPLEEAVNLVVGAQEGTRMNARNPGWVLWQKAISSKKDWVVRDCQRDGIHCVHTGDFMQWAIPNEHLLKPGAALLTPERLAAECKRLEDARNHPGCPLDEQDKAKERIQWANGLLRRYVAVGLEAPITKTQSNKDGNDGRRNNQINALLETIKQESMNPLAIPDGGKSKLKALCIKRFSGLFTESGFNHAWKEAKKRGLIKLENPDKYR